MNLHMVFNYDTTNQESKSQYIGILKILQNDFRVRFLCTQWIEFKRASQQLFQIMSLNINHPYVYLPVMSNINNENIFGFALLKNLQLIINVKNLAFNTFPLDLDFTQLIRQIKEYFPEVISLQKEKLDFYYSLEDYFSFISRQIMDSESILLTLQLSNVKPTGQLTSIKDSKNFFYDLEVLFSNILAQKGEITPSSIDEFQQLLKKLSVKTLDDLVLLRSCS